MSTLRSLLTPGSWTEPTRLRARSPEGDWRRPVDGRAPRLDPDESIAAEIRHDAGSFARIDPTRTPRLWTRWEWGALAVWAAVAGFRGWRLWRRVRPFSD